MLRSWTIISFVRLDNLLVSRRCSWLPRSSPRLLWCGLVGRTEFASLCILVVAIGGGSLFLSPLTIWLCCVFSYYHAIGDDGHCLDDSQTVFDCKFTTWSQWWIESATHSSNLIPDLLEVVLEGQFYVYWNFQILNSMDFIIDKITNIEYNWPKLSIAIKRFGIRNILCSNKNETMSYVVTNHYAFIPWRWILSLNITLTLTESE